VTLTEEEQEALYELIHGGHPDWEAIFAMMQEKKYRAESILTCRQFQSIFTDVSKRFYRYMAFSDLFHTIRSMLVPLLQILRAEIPRADVYHTIATGYAGILARLGGYIYHVPYMTTEHGMYTREREEEILRARWVVPDCRELWIRFFYMLSEAAYSGAQVVTSLFERARKTQIEMGCEASKCRVIANGIHYDEFAVVKPREEDRYVNIAAILRIAPIKDVKTMLYAFAELKKHFGPARLYIAGPEDDPEYARECHELVDRLRIRDDVNFMGTIRVTEHMHKFDFTVLSSISEGQPLSVLESFAAGRPCVTTDVGCCKELINGVGPDQEGPAGLCVPPMQPQSLSQAMEVLCVNRALREAMGKAGKHRAEKYFQHTDMIRNYQAAYDEVFRLWQE
jgi:glycosyltransferase involved in cell wall biosynthesis